MMGEPKNVQFCSQQMLYLGQKIWHFYIIHYKSMISFQINSVGKKENAQQYILLTHTRNIFLLMSAHTLKKRVSHTLFLITENQSQQETNWFSVYVCIFHYNHGTHFFTNSLISFSACKVPQNHFYEFFPTKFECI